MTLTTIECYQVRLAQACCKPGNPFRFKTWTLVACFKNKTMESIMLQKQWRYADIDDDNEDDNDDDPLKEKK